MLRLSLFLKNKYILPNKTADWVKLVAITGGAQAAIQAFGLISGIIIIRLLPIKEYAFYTIANTMLGTMVVLADCGISLGVMAQGGKIWKDPEKLGVVIVSGIGLRRKFAVLSLIVALPFLFYLLIHQGAGLLKTCLIAAAIIPAFYAALSDSLLEVAPKLLQDVKSLQRNQLSVSIFRLVLSFFTVLLFPYAYLILIAAGIPRMWGNFKLFKISGSYADLTQKQSKPVQTEILGTVKRILPGTIYYCVSGQVTIWLLSIFGSTNSLAHVGGLSRLAAVLTIFASVSDILIAPRFARLPNQRTIIIKRFLQIQAVALILCFFITSLAVTFPDQFTFILGKNYSGLKTEAVLVIASGCVLFLSASVYKLSAGRGIVPSPRVFLTSVISVQVLLFFLVDYKHETGALLMALYTAVFCYFFRIFYFFRYMFVNYRSGNK